MLTRCASNFIADADPTFPLQAGAGGGGRATWSGDVGGIAPEVGDNSKDLLCCMVGDELAE